MEAFSGVENQDLETNIILFSYCWHRKKRRASAKGNMSDFHQVPERSEPSRLVNFDFILGKTQSVMPGHSEYFK